jgi:hypothetical protein
MGILLPFRSQGSIHQVELPVWTPQKRKGRFFQNNPFPLNLLFQKGHQFGLQKEPFRIEEIEGPRTIFDAKIFKRHSRPFPQADSGVADGHLSPEGLGQGVFNDLFIKDRIKKIMNK